MRRMDRYESQSEEPKVSRIDKNKDLYDNIGSNTRYTSISDVTTANAIDLTSKKDSTKREGYRQMKEYQDVLAEPKVKRELEEFKSIYQSHENRVYDINNVLEEARKNRSGKDSLEEKRKLKNNSYNILASINKEELEKYRQEKKDKLLHPDESELRDLIDTIASKTLAGDLKAASNLLGDLMATSIMDKVDKPIPDTPNEEDDEEETDEIEKEDETEQEDEDDQENEEDTSKEVLDQKQLQELAEKEETSQSPSVKDDSFYTKSMDLSDQDFEMDDEFKEKTLPLGIKILIVLIVLIVLTAAFYFVWQNI